MPGVERQRSRAPDAPPPAPPIWPVVAAFGTYFCMYAFRKPFTAASFEGGEVWGLGEKTLLVTAQVLGYAASKVIGIRVVAETPPARRARGIVLLIATAESSLLLFAVAPSPLHVACLFVNGLSLGMVFGLVLGFLEGRRNTEVLAAGLCASFILADGVAKSVGMWALGLGVSERWMPATAGLLFFLPLVMFVALLSRTRLPDPADVASRGDRPTMGRVDRAAMVRRQGVGLFLIVVAYLAVTIARSVRADFMPELWKRLGVEATPETFSRSELIVALVVLAVNGLAVLIVDNRRAFFAAIAVASSGGLLMLGSIVAVQRSWIGGFAFVVLIGTGLYLPYVAIHTTIFERLIAMTRDRGNIGFLMYVADSVGYLGYVALMVGRGFLPTGRGFLPFFLWISGLAAAITTACLALCWAYYAGRTSATSPAPPAARVGAEERGA